MEDIFSTLILDYDLEIYRNYKLVKATIKNIIEAILQEEKVELRTRFLITDKLGRLFNAVPIAYDNDHNVLFNVLYDPSNSKSEYFWWSPRSLDGAKYVSQDELTQNRKNKPKNKIAVSKTLLSMTEITDNEEGTDEVINIKRDPFERKIFLACQKYPFGGVQNPKQGNVQVYEFYLTPSTVNINLMPSNMQTLYARILERSRVYSDSETEDDEEDVVADNVFEKLDLTLQEQLQNELGSLNDVANEEVENVVEPEAIVETVVEPEAIVETVEKPVENVLEPEAKVIETVEKPVETTEKLVETVLEPEAKVEKLVEPTVETSEKPVEPTEKPVEPTEKPIETIEKPIETIEKPVSTPEKPVSTPEKPVSTPEKPTETPEKPVETLEKPVETPEKPVETPEKPVETPEKPHQSYTELSNNTLLTEVQIDKITNGIFGDGHYLYYPTNDKKYYWLNDTSHHQITINDLKFPTLEHYYHYMKFIMGLDNPRDLQLSKWGYELILGEKHTHDIKHLTEQTGQLRSKMTKFSNKKWNKEKDSILFYGRINKILQNKEVKDALLSTNDIHILKKVKNVVNIPKEKMTQILGSAVYFDPVEKRWYGGLTEDPWITLRKLVRDNQLTPENIEKYLK